MSRLASAIVSGIAISALLIVLGGCSASRYTVPRILRSDNTIVKQQSQPWYEQVNDDGAPRSYQIEVMNPYTYGEWGDKGDKNAQMSFYSIAAGRAIGAGSGERELARNQLQNAVIRLSDQAVSMHLSALKASESGWNNSLGFSTLALAAAATATTGGAATGLAAGATVTSGTRSLINEQEFRNALVESIIVLIEKDRAQTLERIRQNQRQQIQAYDVEQAIADASDYHQRGSFYHGLALLAEAARKSGNELEQSTSALVKAKVELSKLMGQGDGRARLEKFLGFEPAKPGDPDQRSVAQRVQVWMERALPDQIASAVSYLRASGNLTEGRLQLVSARADADRLATDLSEALELFRAAELAEKAASDAAAAEQADLNRVLQLNDEARSRLAPASVSFRSAMDQLEKLKSEIGSTQDRVRIQELQAKETTLQSNVTLAETTVASLTADIEKLTKMAMAKTTNVSELKKRAAEAAEKSKQIVDRIAEIRLKLEEATKVKTALEAKYYQDLGTDEATTRPPANAAPAEAPV